MTNYIIDHLLEIIAILAAFVIFFMQLRRKVLSYSIIINSSVISVPDKVPSKFVIHYDQNIVSNLWLVEIRIKNTGNVPIKPDDYIEPLAILNPKSDLLSFEINKPNPLGAQIIEGPSNRNTIILSKTLLNPKDYYDVKMVVTGERPNPSVVGRIIGVSKIQQSVGREAYDLLSLLALFAIAIIVSALLFWIWLNSRFSLGKDITSILFLGFLVVLIVYFVFIILRRIEQ